MKLSVERRRQRADLIKLITFLVLAAVVTVWVAAVTAAYRPGDRETYSAVFDDVSGLSTGDAVRIAGVDVGKVESIDVQDDSSVLVTVQVRRDQALSTATTAAIQYRNLTGDRIVQLSQGRPGAPRLAAGGTIPIGQTAAALDLDTLLNGFRPLFAGLVPSEINELSGQLIGVLQGQRAAVANLVSHVARFTTTIGNREQLIGQVVRNLNSVLGAVDERSEALSDLIVQMDALLTGLDRQDTRLLDAASSIDAFARQATGLLNDARGDLRTDLSSLTAAARGVNRQATTFQEVLTSLPKHYRAMQEVTSYGNFFNFFMCGVRIQTDLGTSPWINSDAARCGR